MLLLVSWYAATSKSSKTSEPSVLTDNSTKRKELFSQQTKRTELLSPPMKSGIVTERGDCTT